MKASFILFAVMAAVVSAQSVLNCTVTSLLPATYTLTNTVVSTYCPACDIAKLNGAVYTTVYAAAYLAVCPSGLATSTYTVSAVCTGTSACPSIPSGYTTTAVVCTGCAGSPTITVTTPIAAATTAKFTGAAQPVSANGITALAAGLGSAFFGMLLL